MNTEYEIAESVETFVIPEWFAKCTIMPYDWVTYKGNVYCADYDFEESERLQKPVFNLAFCITRALNECWLRTGIVYENRNIKKTNKAN